MSYYKPLEVADFEYIRSPQVMMSKRSEFGSIGTDSFEVRSRVLDLVDVDFGVGSSQKLECQVGGVAADLLRLSHLLAISSAPDHLIPFAD